jgi:hypothetical protein
MSVLFPGNSISVIRGSTKIFQLQLLDASATPRPLDISGAYLMMTIKRVMEDTEILMFKTSNRLDQIEIVAPREGRALIKFIPEDTHRLDPKQYVYDLWLRFPDGRRIVAIPPSIFEVELGVTWVPLD